MHATIVGAGALGQLYGVRLSTVGVTVDFLVRPSRAQESAPFILEAQVGDRRRDVLASPRRVTEIAKDTDVVLVAVHFEQLLPEGSGAALVDTLRSTRAPILVLSPMLSTGQAGLERALGRPVLPCLPGVAAYLDEEGVVRFWFSALAPTCLDDGAQHPDLAEAARSVRAKLSAAGLPSVLRSSLGRTNTALTVAFFPWIASILPARGVVGLGHDRALLDTTRASFHETLQLGRQLGLDSMVWGAASALTTLAGPWGWRALLRLGELLAPGLMGFLDHHFGPKLRAQHLALGRAVLELGRERSLPMPSTARLVEAVAQAA